MSINPNSANNTFGLKRGKQTNTMREAFRLKGAIEKAAQKASLRRCWVRQYHFASQTVDVVPMDDPGVVIYSVPIRRSFGALSITQPLVGFTNNRPTRDTDIGELLYTDVETDYFLSGADRATSRHVNARGRPIGPTFWPGDIHDDGLPFVPEADEQEGDVTLRLGEVRIIMRKDRGDGKSQIQLVADDVVFRSPDQDADGVPPVARQGDAGDGLGGGIAGGSGVVRSG